MGDYVSFAADYVHRFDMYALAGMVETTRCGEEESRGRPESGNPVFRIHIAGYALYCVIIGDSLVNRGEMGFPERWRYLAAMGFHRLVVTSALSREHGTLYHARGRWVLAVGILAGWAIAVLVTLSEVAMSRLFAFVAGGSAGS